MSVIFEFFQAKEATEEETDKAYQHAVSLIEKLEFRNMMRDEEDRFSVILTINSGAGGTESCDWAEMLLRMYTRWGERNKYNITLIDRQEGDVAGIKSATIELDGPYGYGYLKS